jgi:hypothetical protein
VASGSQGQQPPFAVAHTGIATGAQSLTLERGFPALVGTVVAQTASPQPKGSVLMESHADAWPTMAS